MSRTILPSARVISEEELRNEIQTRLSSRQADIPDTLLVVDDARLDDGCWRVQVSMRGTTAEGGALASVLADVEEDIMTDYGVNVMLVPGVRIGEE